MDDNLIGYLLDALDPPDKDQVEEQLRSNPQTRLHLELYRRALAPLAADAEQPEPPRHLAVGALARIAEHQCRGLPPAPPPPRASVPFPRWLRRPDLAVAASLLILLGGLAVPAIVQLWGRSGIQACQNNLEHYYRALQTYASTHNGKFPQIDDQGPRSFAGSFVSHLHESGLSPQAYLACAPGQSIGLCPRIEEVEKLREQPDSAEFERRARELAGNYAYTLGYRNANGAVVGLNQQDDQYQPIMADHWWMNGQSGENSPNHGGKGQNVLYLNGSVGWHTTPKVGHANDHIYLNRDGKVEAGVGPDDTVLGSGEASPGPHQ
jgi:hypothetical protein